MNVIHRSESLMFVWEINRDCNLMRIELKRIALVNPLKLRRGAVGVSCTISAVGRTALRQQYSTQQKWAYRRFCRSECMNY